MHALYHLQCKGVAVPGTQMSKGKSSVDEWIKKLWYTYKVEYYSATKGNETMPFVVTRMDLEIIITEVSEVKKDKYHMTSFIEWNLKKMIQMNLFTKQKEIHRLRKKVYGYQRGKGRGR